MRSISSRLPGTESQGSPMASLPRWSLNRGITWKWKWNTLCQASTPLQFRKVHTIRPEPVLGPSGDLLREMDARCQVFGGDVEQVGRVRTRDHKSVAMGHRVDVHERYCPFALSDRRR